MDKINTTIRHVFHRKFAHMTLFGFSAGLPYFLIFSSLSLWLDQVGIEKASITMFSWAALGYSFKFLWSPLVDRLPVLFLTRKLGQRRGWLLLIQLLIVFSLVWMASIDPAKGRHYLSMMAFASVLLGFSAATQDILIDAWRIEASNKQDIAMLSSLYIIGYRLGMITSGAGALYLADYFGTSVQNYVYKAWQSSYLIMSSLMLVGIVTTLVIKEPKRTGQQLSFETRDYLAIVLIFVIAVLSFISMYSFTSPYKKQFIEIVASSIANTMVSKFLFSLIQLVLAFVVAIAISQAVYKAPFTNRTMIRSVYIEPVADLFKRHKKHMWLLIGIICTYRISDIVMGVSANLFYQYMGFDLSEIAGVVKTFGLIMTLTGGFVGGLMVVKYGIIRIMIYGAVLSASTNILFMIMAQTGKSIEFLVLVISADNLSSGVALAAFIGFLSLLVNKTFTAVQYAMFSSVMTLFPKILGGFSGSFVESWGFANFFLLTALIGIPVVVMLLYAQRQRCFEFE